MAIKAIFFDFGNTLVDERIFRPAGDREAIREIIKIYRISKSLSACFPLAKKAWESIETSVLPNLDTVDPQNSGEITIKSFAKNLIELIGKKPNPRAIDSVYRAVLKGVATSNSLFPHTGEVLLTLKKRGYELGIISNNMVEYVIEPLKHLGIKDFFEVVVTSGEEKVGKPNPEIFNIALDRFGIKPGEGAMVGDSLKEDIVGAHNVEMETIWINRSGKNSKNRIKADYVIQDLRDLLSIFKVNKNSN